MPTWEQTLSINKNSLAEWNENQKSSLKNEPLCGNSGKIKAFAINLPNNVDIIIVLSSKYTF